MVNKIVPPPLFEIPSYGPEREEKYSGEGPWNPPPGRFSDITQQVLV